MKLNKSHLLFSFLLATILFMACSKDNTSPAAKDSKMSLLTTNVWIYDSVYANWGYPNQTLVYVLNGKSNSQDYSGDRLKFYTDGPFKEIFSLGVLRQGVDTWYMNADSTILNTSGGGYTNSVIIESISKTKLVWLDNANKARGVQIPKY